MQNTKFKLQNKGHTVGSRKAEFLEMGGDLGKGEKGRVRRGRENKKKDLTCNVPTPQIEITICYKYTN